MARGANDVTRNDNHSNVQNGTRSKKSVLEWRGPGGARIEVVPEVDHGCSPISESLMSLGSPTSPGDIPLPPSSSTHPPPTSALVDLCSPVSSTGVTEAFTGDSSPQGEKEKPAGTWAANLAQGEEGQGTSSESRPSNSDTNGGDVRHQAPSTLANVEVGRELQASCTREHQNLVTALWHSLS